MKYINNKVEEIKIAYIGGGSRGWAWGFMSDLVSSDDISGDVYLYDIDYEASMNNEIIGNLFNEVKDAKSKWNYHASFTPKEALTGADFVIISILPGTFDEMESDVNTPEKYGIYQSVGDTTGPGGIVRAMRTIPMYEDIANYIKEYCPDAWVINYTNPMTLCVKTLYRVFPKIKAFGCCHEVFNTQKVLMEALEDIKGIKVKDRYDIKVNPVGVNHFTWFTNAKYQNLDLFPIYEEFVNKYYEKGYTKKFDNNWMNNHFECSHRVKFDLFRKYGYIAAAGDRHLAEFVDGKLYLDSPSTPFNWGFTLTPVSWRKKDLKQRLERSKRLINKEEKVSIAGTGEEGVNQIRALLGLCELVTNVNIPNIGQISNLPIGAVVETNAVFRDGSVTPVFTGAIPESIYPLVYRICIEQVELNEALAARDILRLKDIFSKDPLVTISKEEAENLFKEMCENTKEYLSSYNLKLL